MRTLQRSIGMLLILTVIFALPGCGLLGFHSWEWKQKITIRVKTPDGERIGSAVQRVSWNESPSWARLGDSGGWFSGELTGEAAVVEVRPGKYLFVLLKAYSELDNLKIFTPENANSLASTKEFREQLRTVNDRLEGVVQARELPRSLYPQLATFGDASNSATIQLVDPENPTKTFGPGVSLLSITLGTTTEPMTVGRVEQVLPWFYSVDSLIPREQIPWLAKDVTPVQRVSKFDFITGNLWRKK